DDAREMSRLPLDQPHVLAVERAVVVDHLRREQDRAERIAELVAEDGEEAVPLVDAILELVHEIADLVLAQARTQSRLRGADQALDAHRAIDEGDVRAPAELVEGTRFRLEVGQSRQD